MQAAQQEATREKREEAWEAAREAARRRAEAEPGAVEKGAEEPSAVAGQRIRLAPRESGEFFRSVAGVAVGRGTAQEKNSVGAELDGSHGGCGHGKRCPNLQSSPRSYSGGITARRSNESGRNRNSEAAEDFSKLLYSGFRQAFAFPARSVARQSCERNHLTQEITMEIPF